MPNEKTHPRSGTFQPRGSGKELDRLPSRPGMEKSKSRIRTNGTLADYIDRYLDSTSFSALR
jgi:hypothetical protein